MNVYKKKREIANLLALGENQVFLNIKGYSSVESNFL